MKTKVFLLTVTLLVSFFYAASLKAFDSEERVLIILDLSKSMNESLQTNETKIEVAKKAVTDVISSLPDDTSIGLRVYGHKSGFLGMNQCSKTELIAPIKPYNKETILDKVKDLEPNGVTPIAYSLKKAIGDFKGFEGSKRIVLISDGLETCNGDPCSFAKRLRSEGLNIKIDVISFGKNIKNFSIDSQLQCIALATQGQFSRAETHIDLVKAINNSVRVDKQIHWTIKPNY
ncbi:MAG: VWA domain-containing protein [Cyanobacteriota bacterium]